MESSKEEARRKPDGTDLAASRISRGSALALSMALAFPTAHASEPEPLDPSTTFAQNLRNQLDKDWEYSSSFPDVVKQSAALFGNPSEQEIEEDIRFFIERQIPIAIRNLEEVILTDGESRSLTQVDRTEAQDYLGTLNTLAERPLSDFILVVGEARDIGSDLGSAVNRVNAVNRANTVSRKQALDYNWLTGELVISREAFRKLKSLEQNLDPSEIKLKDIIPLEVSLYNYLQGRSPHHPALEVVVAQSFDVHRNDPLRRDFINLLSQHSRDGVSYDQHLLERVPNEFNDKAPPFTEELVADFAKTFRQELEGKEDVEKELRRWFVYTQRSIEFPMILASCLLTHPNQDILAGFPQEQFGYRDSIPNSDVPAARKPHSLRDMIDLHVAVSGLDTTIRDFVENGLDSHPFTFEKGFNPALHFIQWFQENRFADSVLRGTPHYYSLKQRQELGLNAAAWEAVGQYNELRRAASNTISQATNNELIESGWR